MKLRIVSDLHLECDLRQFHTTRPIGSQLVWEPPSLPDDAETVLIIAGDISNHGWFIRENFYGDMCWLQLLAQRFKHIVLVLGNHDYWYRILSLEPKWVADSITERGLTNVTLLERSSVLIDDVLFLGGTLWTDYHQNDSRVMAAAKTDMPPDFRFIRTTSKHDFREIKPRDLYDICQQTKGFIFGQHQPARKKVVVTHMLPSFSSIHESYKTYENLTGNFSFYSDLDKQILASDIDLWVHGHTHCKADYTIDKCRVICNPRGYSNKWGVEVRPGGPDNWNPTLAIDI